jgi:hypothetical protein
MLIVLKFNADFMISFSIFESLRIKHQNDKNQAITKRFFTSLKSKLLIESLIKQIKLNFFRYNSTNSINFVSK